ncbi:transcriptional regulator, MarR family [Catenulispora acidiphila DSM 44928]|uniref:Transcriptional regulator, MarR family n=1 Tax=Catenulispora acidiphila (strain DSM 44928 / JCM 14897 / NBRC 102108 / NRRL B-24433 / ID139908) TaxID=479433 RepID=C7Q1N8_CATAD|nr:MarR family transcriptional regulator [Catenulispora acidiphila]ACU75589.1 transcriptional regulator, MarR family [Catenulispora acidiphila DSM 44928]
MQPDIHPATPEADTQEVVAAVLAASRMIVGMSARALADVDDSLTLPQLRTLVVLADRPPMKQSDLAAELGVNPSTVLRMADRLAAADLLERQPNPASRREQLLSLTETGCDLVHRVMDRRSEEVTALVGRLTPAERAGLVHSLRALTEAVSDTYPDSPDHPGLRLG